MAKAGRSSSPACPRECAVRSGDLTHLTSGTGSLVHQVLAQCRTGIFTFSQAAVLQLRDDELDKITDRSGRSKILGQDDPAVAAAGIVDLLEPVGDLFRFTDNVGCGFGV